MEGVEFWGENRDFVEVSAHVVDDAGDTDDCGYDSDDDCDVSNLRVMIIRLDMAEESLVKRFPLSYARD